jgi:hypothetical protein
MLPVGMIWRDAFRIRLLLGEAEGSEDAGGWMRRRAT